MEFPQCCPILEDQRNQDQANDQGATGLKPTPSPPAVPEEPMGVLPAEEACADGESNVIGFPSTLMIPPVADAGIKKV